MLGRLRDSYSDPAKAQRYGLAALLIATAALVAIGIGNAVDPPEPDSIFKKEDAVGILLVIGQTLLHSTASIITGAALIMVAVFGGFALGPLSMFQQMGFGLAVAVILDATIVRMVLVPASMELLGDKNWYFPSWLEWVPRISIEGNRNVAAANDTSAGTSSGHPIVTNG